MRECSKSISRRLADSRFATRYFVGRGLDIGGKPDPLALYLEFFPLANSIRTWDWEDGDAQFLGTEPDESYDFVHSSHCLEHLVSPWEGLRNWFRVVRPGGHLVITVPDEDLYEQGEFPSTFNKDHKHTFTIWKSRSWSDRSINVINLAESLGPSSQLLKLELLDATFRQRLPRYDQTMTPVGESAIEIVIRKRTREEVESGGRMPPAGQPDPLVRIHLNQYRDDRGTILGANPTHPPFRNDDPL
jgi:SAM-dependent methyltransferase